MILYHSVTITFLNKFSLNLFVGWPDEEFQIDASEFSSCNDFMLGQNLMLSIINELELYTYFCLRGPKNLFELTNFVLSDGVCQYVIANVHGIKKFVRVSESSNYLVYELMGVVCSNNVHFLV